MVEVRKVASVEGADRDRAVRSVVLAVQEVGHDIRLAGRHVVLLADASVTEMRSASSGIDLHYARNDQVYRAARRPHRRGRARRAEHHADDAGPDRGGTPSDAGGAD